MKKIYILICSVFLTTGILAQTDAISKYFSDYQNDDAFTKVNISGKMFELFMHVEAEGQEDKDLIEAVSKLKGLKVLISDTTQNGNEIYNAALKRLPSEYEVLMSVDDNSEELTFFIREGNGKIEEFLLLARGEGDFFLIDIFGEIDLSQISKLSSTLDISGFNHLEKFQN